MKHLPKFIPCLLFGCALLSSTGCTDGPAPTADVENHDHTAMQTENGEVTLYTCGMHPQIVQEGPGTCPICNMNLTPLRRQAAEEGIVAIDPVTMQNIGVRTTQVEAMSIRQTVKTTGMLEADPRNRAVVSLKVNGWIETLHIDFEGERIQKGQPLFELYSPELISTQEEYLLARRNLQQMQGKTGQAEAQRLLDAAQRRLGYWDIPTEQIGQLEASGSPQRTLTFYAPVSGTVVMHQVIEGQQVRAGTSLMEIVDLSQIWLMVDVHEQDLDWVKPGTTAQIEWPYDPGIRLTGRVDYLYDTLDPATRTVKARIVLRNGNRAFKPGMFATVTLEGAPTPSLPTVPEDALLRSSKQAWVVVDLGEGRFRPIEVEIGQEADGFTQILNGLQPGARVVTRAQFLIDSEARLKSAVGALMSDHQHGDMDAMLPGDDMNENQLPEPMEDHNMEDPDNEKPAQTENGDEYVGAPH